MNMWKIPVFSVNPNITKDPFTQYLKHLCFLQLLLFAITLTYVMKVGASQACPRRKEEKKEVHNYI